MGVTLERVQNKFACIIGELCNEPYVLSQFAIWVDLRIAEYKANGAISLDCTGDNPHPTWLKGMNPPKSSTPNQSLNQSGSSRRHGRFDSLGNPTSATESCGLSFDSGEYEIVEVKEEPPDFPTCTSFKSHGRLSPTRKRISENQDFLESDNSVFPTSAPKSRRLSAASEYTGISTVGQDTVSNQSFMSVIGLTDHTAHSVDNLNLPSDEKSPFSKFDQSKGSNQGNVSFDDVTIHPSVSTDEDELSWRRFTSSNSPPFSSRDGNVRSRPQGHVPNRSHATFTSTTAANTRSAVKLFERWLMTPPLSDKRRIEEMAPSELDEYLTVFWQTTRRRSGEQYQPKSLKLLRTRLERHLRDPSISFLGNCQGVNQRNSSKGEQGCSTNTELTLTSPENLSQWHTAIPSRNTTVNTRSAVSIFERWARHLPFPEGRKIEDIPLPDLDILLAEFWMHIRRQDGADYHPNFLRQLRTRLECHLRNFTSGQMQRRRQFGEAENFGGFRFEDSQLHQLSLKCEEANMNTVQRGYPPCGILDVDSSSVAPLPGHLTPAFCANSCSSGRSMDVTLVTNNTAFPSSRNTAVNTKSAVSIFERWARSLERPEFRRIEDIPVEELDVLLAEFWKNVRQKNGSDYHPKSLIQLRTRLEWHLRSCQYPVSIVNPSIGFSTSIGCFKERIRYLNSLLSETEKLT